ncbi:MAG: histidine phosphatase family protein [Lentisphaeria bacterium]|nr:histidine phosphatase family protein [Lentisphaeria bacterium]
MKLLIIRHAESNGNAAGGDYSVDNADALSPRGQSQAEALAPRLGAWDIGTVVVSPQQRALQTIAPYLAATSRTAEVWPELAEACWQEEREPPADAWDSQPAALPRDIAKYFTWRDGQAIRPASWETFGTGLRRVYDALERIEKQFGSTKQTILLAAHGFFIREMMNLMLKRPRPEAFDHDNCGMTLMTFSKEWNMEFRNRKGSGIS